MVALHLLITLYSIAIKQTRAQANLCTGWVLWSIDSRNVLQTLTGQTSTWGEEVDDSPEHNDEDKAESGVNDQALALLFGFVVSTTKDEVLEYSPDEYQEADTENEWDEDIIRK